MFLRGVARLMATTTSVLVIGGGPVGAAAALGCSCVLPCSSCPSSTPTAKQPPWSHVTWVMRDAEDVAVLRAGGPLPLRPPSLKRIQRRLDVQEMRGGPPGLPFLLVPQCRKVRSSDGHAAVSPLLPVHVGVLGSAAVSQARPTAPRTDVELCVLAVPSHGCVDALRHHFDGARSQSSSCQKDQSPPLRVLLWCGQGVSQRGLIPALETPQLLHDAERPNSSRWFALAHVTGWLDAECAIASSLRWTLEGVGHRGSAATCNMALFHVARVAKPMPEERPSAVFSGETLVTTDTSEGQEDRATTTLLRRCESATQSVLSAMHLGAVCRDSCLRCPSSDGSVVAERLRGPASDPRVAPGTLLATVGRELGVEDPSGQLYGAWAVALLDAAITAVVVASGLVSGRRGELSSDEDATFAGRARRAVESLWWLLNHSGDGATPAAVARGSSAPLPRSVTHALDGILRDHVADDRPAFALGRLLAGTRDVEASMQSVFGGPWITLDGPWSPAKTLVASGKPPPGREKRGPTSASLKGDEAKPQADVTAEGRKGPASTMMDTMLGLGNVVTCLREVTTTAAEAAANTTTVAEAPPVATLPEEPDAATVARHRANLRFFVAVADVFAYLRVGRDVGEGLLLVAPAGGASGQDDEGGGDDYRWMDRPVPPSPLIAEMHQLCEAVTDGRYVGTSLGKGSPMRQQVEQIMNLLEAESK